MSTKLFLMKLEASFGKQMSSITFTKWLRKLVDFIYHKIECQDFILSEWKIIAMAFSQRIEISTRAWDVHEEHEKI